MNLSPIGLFFAALLALLIALGEVCNKKVVQGQQVVAAVFWIRAFAAIEFTLVLLVFAWRGSPPVIHAPAALVPGDFQNLPALVVQLQHPANPAVRRIADALSGNTRTELAGYRPGVNDSQVVADLTKELNGENVIAGALLYRPEEAPGVKLAPAVRQLIGKKPRGEMRSYTNRLLLESLFPSVIAQRRTCALFGVSSLQTSPLTAFLVYLLIEVILVAASQSLTTYALKISPMSLCMPFTAFTPIFLLGTGYVVLRELPTVVQTLGIALIVIGGILMQRKLFGVSWKAPIQAILREKGSRYILISVLIASLYGPVEKQLILMSDPLTTAFAYGIGTVVAFLVICKVLGVQLKQVMQERPGWALLAGLSDANTLFSQFIAVMYLPVVIAICIKRAGIVLTVLAGWLIFKERDITDRLIASSAMVGGIVILYLPLQFSQALALTCLVLVGVAVALYLTRGGARNRALAATAAP